MKNWTKEELKLLLKSKRKYKTIRDRKAKEGNSTSMLIKETSERTGFAVTAIKEIIYNFTDVAREKLLKGEYVTIRHICTLHPIVSRARTATNLKGGVCSETMILPPRWELKAFTNVPLKIELSDKEVTQEDVNNLYK